MRCGTNNGSGQVLPIKIKITTYRSQKVEVEVKKRRQWWQEFIAL